MQILLAIFLALIPAIIWLFFYYLKDSKDPEPKPLIIKIFIAGAIASLPFMGLRYLLTEIPGAWFLLTSISSALVFALLEEIAKISAAVLISSKNNKAFNQIIDGVVYSVTAALGFAFAENILYFYEFILQTNSSIISVFAFRSLGTMLAHTLFSATAGLIWGYAHFSSKITPFNKKHLLAFELKDLINHEIYSLHIIRNNILKAHPSRRGGHEKKILVFEGIITAAILHTLFNLTTTFELLGSPTIIIVPALMTGLFYVSHLFVKKLNTKIYQVI